MLVDNEKDNGEADLEEDDVIEDMQNKKAVKSLFAEDNDNNFEIDDRLIVSISADKRLVISSLK